MKLQIKYQKFLDHVFVHFAIYVKDTYIFLINIFIRYFQEFYVLPYKNKKFNYYFQISKNSSCLINYYHHDI